MRNHPSLPIDADRLWRSHEEMGQLGATPKGGVNRQALTAQDQQARALFTQWAQAAGCIVETDCVGNLFARRLGRDPDLPAVCTGSNLDTQPTGGKYDGAYGVLAGLEILRALNDAGIETERSIESSPGRMRKEPALPIADPRCLRERPIWNRPIMRQTHRVFDLKTPLSRSGQKAPCS